MNEPKIGGKTREEWDDELWLATENSTEVCDNLIKAAFAPYTLCDKLPDREGWWLYKHGPSKYLIVNVYTEDNRLRTAWGFITQDPEAQWGSAPLLGVEG